MKNQHFELHVDGLTAQQGTTDGDGKVDVSLPPNAESAMLIVGTGQDQHTFKLNFGHIDPIDTDSGVAERLSNLGYPAEDDPSAAIESFQEQHGLTVTGEVDQATRDKLKEVFGE